MPAGNPLPTIAMSSHKRNRAENPPPGSASPARPDSPRDFDARRTSLPLPPGSLAAPTRGPNAMGPMPPPPHTAVGGPAHAMHPTGAGFMAGVDAPAAAAPARRARAAVAMPAEEGLGRVVDEHGVRRSARTQAIEARETAALMARVPAAGDTHFGHDMTAGVEAAQADYRAGLRSDPDQRAALRRTIDRSARTSADLSQLLPGAMRQHVEQHLGGGNTVSQDDGRVHPERGGAYAGAMFTSSHVRGRGMAAGGEEGKQTGRPRSPQPSDADGPADRTHASPHALVGAESNDVRTVWARKSANLIVDGHIERVAQQSHERGDHLTMVVRADTHDRSSVGVLSQGAAGGAFTLHSAQYQRRPTPAGVAPAAPAAPAAPSASGPGGTHHAPPGSSGGGSG
ncbi:hypothetical protein YWS52_31500 [Chitiniphilus shinanonensis]